MAIDIRYIVTVTPSILPPGASGLELNGLLLTKNENIPTGGDYKGLLQFPTAADIGEYFGTESDEYTFATKYFAGSDISLRRPRNLFVAAFVDEPRAPWLRGSAFTPLLGDFTTISDGTLTLNFSGTPVTITPINLSTATSFSDVATIVQGAIRAAGEGNEAVSTATVTFDGATTTFTIRGGLTGAGLVIDGAAGTVAEAMHIDDAHGPVVSHGMDAATVNGTMEGIKKVTQNWATFTHLWKGSINEMLSFAQWQAQYRNSFLYVPYDDDDKLLITGNTDNSAAVIRAINADVALVYGGYKYAAFIMGMAASIDYTGANTVMNYAHRSQTGLEYNVNDTVDARALEDKRVNFYGNYALRNDQFEFLFPGCTLGGWRWIDHYVNSIWFFSALETSAAYLLRNAPVIHYTQAGASLIRSGYQGAINAARQNGTITAGVELSEVQKSVVIAQAGQDITAELERNGYYLSIQMPSVETRQDRGSTFNRLWYVFGGSVNRLDLGAVSLT